MICPPCAQYADAITKQSETYPGVGFARQHPPERCRDHAIQPHGCACAHGQIHQPQLASTPRTREAQPA